MSVLSLALLIIPAAQATLLKGYVKANYEEALASVTANAEPSAQAAPAAVYAAPAGPPEFEALAAEPVPSPAESAMHQHTEQLQQALIESNSFPISFAGAWRVVTVVTGSAVATVPVGGRIESQVSFARQYDGRILAQWQQAGWNEAQERITPMNDHEASLERTNCYYDQGAAGEWQAKSHDHYLKVGADRMVASSQVDQYVGGQYVGRYETRSTLYRFNNNVAYAR